MYGGGFVRGGFVRRGFVRGGFVRAPFYTHVTSLECISHSSRTLHTRLISMSMQLPGNSNN